jgi:hypothetical protein
MWFGALEPQSGVSCARTGTLFGFSDKVPLRRSQDRGRSIFRTAHFKTAKRGAEVADSVNVEELGDRQFGGLVTLQETAVAIFSRSTNNTWERQIDDADSPWLIVGGCTSANAFQYSRTLR